MVKKLAITIAGAVSLGSYESGVAFEILDAIAQHNGWADQNDPEERIEIDVLTGASAGGMTASMIAGRLLYDGASMKDPYSNPLYNAWVRDVDVTGLLACGPDEPPTHSIFSSDCVIAISKKYLTARYATLPAPAPVAHPALGRDRKLTLGLALSNLNGVDYIRPTQSGGTFVYTDHQDQRLMHLEQTASDRAEVWETIRASAVACGAFPMAFRVQDLVRNLAEYPGSWLDKSLWGGAPSRYFTYTDGGVFQNQPLGMAKNCVDEMPEGHLQAEQRAYLFVAPAARKSVEVPYTTDKNTPANEGFGSANADYLAMTERLAESIYDQSGFQDWIVAEDVNDKLNLLDARAAELQGMFERGELTAAISQAVSDVVLRAFFMSEQNPTAARQAAHEQLKQQYAVEYARFGANTATADAWVDAVLVLELAADLHEKETMLIYDFVADPKLLAGSGLEAFGGFFDVAYRKHDYDYGRSMGQQQLQKYKSQGGFFANLHWTPKPIDPIDPKLNNLQMANIDKEKRKKVCGQICAAANDLLAEMNMNLIVRKLAMKCFIEKKVEKLLGL